MKESVTRAALAGLALAVFAGTALAANFVPLQEGDRVTAKGLIDDFIALQDRIVALESATANLGTMVDDNAALAARVSALEGRKTRWVEKCVTGPINNLTIHTKHIQALQTQVTAGSAYRVSIRHMYSNEGDPENIGELFLCDGDAADSLDPTNGCSTGNFLSYVTPQSQAGAPNAAVYSTIVRPTNNLLSVTATGLKASQLTLNYICLSVEELVDHEEVSAF